MVTLIVFITGVVLGFVFAYLYIHVTSGYGLFRIDEVLDTDDPGQFNVTVRLANDQNLTKVDRIILKKEIRG